MKRLKEEYGCKNLKDAQVKVTQAANEEIEYYKEWVKRSKAFKAKVRKLRKKVTGDVRRVLDELLKQLEKMNNDDRRTNGNSRSER